MRTKCIPSARCVCARAFAGVYGRTEERGAQGERNTEADREKRRRKGGRKGGRDEERESEELERYHDDDLPLWEGDVRHVLSWSGDTGLRNTD